MKTASEMPEDPDWFTAVGGVRNTTDSFAVYTQSSVSSHEGW